MAFIPAVNCAEAVIQMTAHSKNMNNVLNFQYATAYGQPELDNLAAAIDSVVGANYLPWVNVATTYNGTLVRGLTSQIDLQAFDNTNAGTGTGSGASLPSNVTLCVTLRTGFTGRSARGRFYSMPAAASALLAASEFTATYTAAMDTLLNNFATAAQSVSWTMVIVSRYSNGLPRTTALTHPVTSIQVRNGLSDSMRSRLPVGH